MFSLSYNNKFTGFLKKLGDKETWGMLRDYLGLGRSSKVTPIEDLDSLAYFLQTRASHVAQTGLYGYLRTRAGTRFPELFDHPDILVSINIAKWQIWLACLSDLTIYLGGLILVSYPGKDEDVRAILVSASEKILLETGMPEEAGSDFVTSIEKLKVRLQNFDWSTFEDNESVFVQSPEALVYWSPVADNLKKLDDSIVRNSMRFRWQEIRRSARELLSSEALMSSISSRD